MKEPSSSRDRFIVFILGVLSTISPFSIDMYLAAFPEIAAELGTTQARVSLSVASYFIGLAGGQLFYGPLLDRYGRKPPLTFGLIVYICMSIGCMCATSVEWLIALRFLQALGGCVAQIAANAMVRDYFPISESAKIFSLLILMIGVSPLLAPSVGTFVALWLGWRWIFAILAIIAALILALALIGLPKGHAPDPTVSLHPRQIVKRYREVLAVRQFRTYSFAVAFSFAGLFAYVAGSPIIFLGHFRLDAKTYSLIFAILTGGFIGSNQINIWLHRHFRSAQIYRLSVFAAFVFAVLLIVGTIPRFEDLYGTIVLLFAFLFCIGLSSPNGAALSLAPFSRNAGTAAAMLGFLQMGVGAVVSSGVGLLEAKTGFPVFCVFTITIAVAITILLIEGRRAEDVPDV